MKVFESITQLIGCTPVLRISKPDSNGASVFAKLESFNPGGSVKDRIAYSMINAAEKSGQLKEGATIVEPTSGNTGIGLALVAASKGYSLILTMPESMTVERRRLLAAYGAKIVLTPAPMGMSGAIEKAKEIAGGIPDSFMPQQFENPANPRIHRETTAEEILHDFGDDLHCFVAGVGTGGTITGAGGALKEKLPHIKVIAVEPVDSPVLSGGSPGPHKIQGIGAGFIPDVLDMEVIDKVEQVTYEEAVEAARYLATEKGILAGISSGAAAHAALRTAADLPSDRNVLVVLPDTGERYLSTELFPVPEID